MMSELGYFTRLIEMTNSGSKDSKKSKDEPQEEVRYNSNDSISIRSDRSDFQSEIFSDKSIDDVDHQDANPKESEKSSIDDIDHQDANPRESEKSQVVIQENLLDFTHINEKKY